MSGTTLVIVGVLAAVVLVGILASFIHRKPRYEYRLKPVMTDNEVEFYGRLRQALPEVEIFPQVAMSAFMRPRFEITGKEGFRARSAYSQKVVDYLCCEKGTLRPVVVIELDDHTHDSRKDSLRDKMVTSSGLCIVRYQAKDRPSAREINSAIMPLMVKHGGRNSPLHSFIGNIKSSHVRSKLAKS